MLVRLAFAPLLWRQKCCGLKRRLASRHASAGNSWVVGVSHALTSLRNPLCGAASPDAATGRHQHQQPKVVGSGTVAFALATEPLPAVWPKLARQVL